MEDPNRLDIHNEKLEKLAPKEVWLKNKIADYSRKASDHKLCDVNRLLSNTRSPNLVIDTAWSEETLEHHE